MVRQLRRPTVRHASVWIACLRLHLWAQATFPGNLLARWLQSAFGAAAGAGVNLLLFARIAPRFQPDFRKGAAGRLGAQGPAPRHDLTRSRRGVLLRRRRPPDTARFRFKVGCPEDCSVWRGVPRSSAPAGWGCSSRGCPGCRRAYAQLTWMTCSCGRSTPSSRPRACGPIRPTCCPPSADGWRSWPACGGPAMTQGRRHGARRRLLSPSRSFLATPCGRSSPPAVTGWRTFPASTRCFCPFRAWRPRAADRPPGGRAQPTGAGGQRP